MAEQLSTSFEKRLDAVDWQDWGMLVLAIWLFISPWVFPYGETNFPGMSVREAAEISAYPASAARVLAVPLGHIGDFRRLQIDEGREMVDPHHWRLHRSRALGVRSHWRGACPRCS